MSLYPSLLFSLFLLSFVHERLDIVPSSSSSPLRFSVFPPSSLSFLLPSASFARLQVQNALSRTGTHKQSTTRSWAAVVSTRALSDVSPRSVFSVLFRFLRRRKKPTSSSLWSSSRFSLVRARSIFLRPCVKRRPRKSGTCLVDMGTWSDRFVPSEATQLAAVIPFVIPSVLVSVSAFNLLLFFNKAELRQSSCSLASDNQRGSFLRHSLNIWTLGARSPKSQEN